MQYWHALSIWIFLGFFPVCSNYFYNPSWNSCKWKFEWVLHSNWINYDIVMTSWTTQKPTKFRHSVAMIDQWSMFNCSPSRPSRPCIRIFRCKFVPWKCKDPAGICSLGRWPWSVLFLCLGSDWWPVKCLLWDLLRRIIIFRIFFWKPIMGEKGFGVRKYVSKKSNLSFPSFGKNFSTYTFSSQIWKKTLFVK